MEEKRRSKREEVQIPATISIRDFSVEASVQNLSEGGALLLTDRGDAGSVEVGDECLLILALHDGGSRSIPSRIARVFDLENESRGFAVTF